ncbi:MAG: DeoR/GlpR transcriptional regulator [Bryobacterales bacterium]|nr:DeoR/GlpR transcriptional regulator [Bryobacterales bacterium]
MKTKLSNELHAQVPANSSQPSHLAHLGYVLESIKAAPEGQRVDETTLPALILAKHHVEVDPSTVKLALKELEGVVCRCPCGFRLSPVAIHDQRGSFFDTRSQRAQEAKRAVAIHAYDHMLDELEAIFLDAGSANYAVAEELAWGSKRNLTVLTNNARAVRILLANPTIRIFVTGGVYDVQDEALVGKKARFDNDWFSCKAAFVGASAISAHHVYNHAITGEEDIKRDYWQIPADELIVPATLGKFRCKDVSCFGGLYRHHPGNEEKDARGDIHHIGEQELVRQLEMWKRQVLANGYHKDVSGFCAEKCTIIVEPEWMIERDYAGKAELKDKLLGKVAMINRNTAITEVNVVHANVSASVLRARYF